MRLLERFQTATVDAALESLSDEGVRRFLIADEVGLGKTIVAREIALALRGSRRRFNLLYLCPSLEIVAQNRHTLGPLVGLSEEEAGSGEDRLTLVPQAPPREGNGFRVLTY